MPKWQGVRMIEWGSALYATLHRVGLEPYRRTPGYFDSCACPHPVRAGDVVFKRPHSCRIRSTSSVTSIATLLVGVADSFSGRARSSGSQPPRSRLCSSRPRRCSRSPECADRQSGRLRCGRRPPAPHGHERVVACARDAKGLINPEEATTAREGPLSEFPQGATVLQFGPEPRGEQGQSVRKRRLPAEHADTHRAESDGLLRRERRFDSAAALACECESPDRSCL